jgi:hypothetical protein
MAHSWADLANSADHFQMMVEATEASGQVKSRFRLRKARPPRPRASVQKRAIKSRLRLRRYR